MDPARDLGPFFVRVCKTRIHRVWHLAQVWHNTERARQTCCRPKPAKRVTLHTYVWMATCDTKGYDIERARQRRAFGELHKVHNTSEHLLTGSFGRFRSATCKVQKWNWNGNIRIPRMSGYDNRIDPAWKRVYAKCLDTTTELIPLKCITAKWSASQN